MRKEINMSVEKHTNFRPINKTDGEILIAQDRFLETPLKDTLLMRICKDKIEYFIKVPENIRSK